LRAPSVLSRPSAAPAPAAVLLPAVLLTAVLLTAALLPADARAAALPAGGLATLPAAALAPPAAVSATSLPGAALPSRLTCYDDVFAPYVMQNAGVVSGLNVDILREAGARLGIAIDVAVMPWRRLESELARRQDSAVDCAFAFSRTPEREAFMEFGRVPMQPTEYALFVRADSPINGLQDMTGKTLGVRAAFRLPDVIRAGAAEKFWQLSEVGTDAANFQKLSLQRVDAVLADSVVGLYTIGQLKLGKLRRLTEPVARFDTYVVFKKSANSAALAAAFDHVFRQMQQDGAMLRLSAPYISAGALVASPVAPARSAVPRRD
jgi:ABC-type amino acid transport substrate-binding protein